MSTIQYSCFSFLIISFYKNLSARLLWKIFYPWKYIKDTYLVNTKPPHPLISLGKGVFSKTIDTDSQDFTRVAVNLSFLLPMTMLFETLRWLFLTLTILLIMFLVIWWDVFDGPTFTSINATLMPAYLLLTGVVIWYSIDLINAEQTDTPEQREKKSSTAYMQWILIWIFLAMLHIFIG